MYSLIAYLVTESFVKCSLSENLNFKVIYLFDVTELVSINRKANAFGYCLATGKRPEIVDFDAAGVYGGIAKEGFEREVLQVPGFEVEGIK